MNARLWGLVLIAALGLPACATSTSMPTNWSEQSSASSGGGMEALIAAARKEGRLNLTMRPSGSAGWAANIEGFQQRYGIQVTLRTDLVGDSGQVDALKVLPGSSEALDVVDVSPDIADASTSSLAPYLVFYWLQIPAALKHPRAYWYEDCGGFMAVGYDPSRVPPVTSTDGLLDPAYHHGVTLAGDVQDESAIVAVAMAAVASGGTPEDTARGIDFFHRLSDAGNLVAWSAADPPSVVIDWDFHQRQGFPPATDWRYTVPPQASVGAYRAQAISRYAPHPAAARLWEEYLLSDTGQNACLRAGARPARLDAMRAEGTLDLAAAASLPPVGPRPYVLTAAQLASARAYLAGHWASAVGR